MHNDGGEAASEAQPASRIQGSRICLEPRERLLVSLALQEGRDLVPHARVVGVDIVNLLAVEHADVDETTLPRDESKGLEAQNFLVHLPGELLLDHPHEVLDADAVLVSHIVARLDAADHTLLEGRRVAGAGANTERPLVHAERGPHTVPRPMRVVHPELPQGRPGESVELVAGGAGGEGGGRQQDMPLEHRSTALDVLSGGVLHEGHGASHVGGPVQVLRARVHQKELLGAEPAIALLRDSVVGDGTVWAGGRDGVKRQHLELGVLGPERLGLGAQVELPHLIAPLHGCLEPAEGPCHGRAVANVSPLHPLHLPGILPGLGDGDGRRLDDGRLPCRLLGRDARRPGVEPELQAPACKLPYVIVDPVIRKHPDTTLFQVPRDLPPRHLALVDVEAHLVPGDDRKGHAHGGVVDVAAPDVEQPAHLHQIAGDVGVRTRLLHGGPEARDLVGDGDPRVLLDVDIGGFLGGGGPPVPHLVEGVVGGWDWNQLVFSQRLLEVNERLEGKGRGVHTDPLAPLAERGGHVAGHRRRTGAGDADAPALGV
mmetsp:Transcript_694/g.1769  ORF Transcript_694/g.1769 Transcript_694/m.1769 type:complete len:543 (+) Transcript_694:48-1676(+)